jgi:hypothetical protein
VNNKPHIPKITSLDIPDDYERMDPELIVLIQNGTEFHQALPFRLDTAKLASFVFVVIRECPGACSGVVYLKQEFGIETKEVPDDGSESARAISKGKERRPSERLS